MDLSDDERDRAIRRLHEAAGDGRLSFVEADERIAAARAASSGPELAALLHDLGTPSAPETALTQFEPYPAAAHQHTELSTGAPLEPGFSPQDPLVLSAGWEGIKRTGKWRVPPFIKASSGVDSVKIDCTLADFASPLIQLELTAGAGSVRLVVPHGWGVRMERLGRGFGSAKSTVDEVPAPGFPLIVVSGGVGLGSFRARHPSRFERWRLKRRGIVLPPPPNLDLR